MAIFDFFQRGKLNKLILRLKEDFNEEIKDFGHFKELQARKIGVVRKIKDIWNEKWKEAEELVKTNMPILIRNQLKFIEIDIRYAR